MLLRHIGDTFTVPQVNYDEYGRITGTINYTVQIPAAPSVTNISGTAAKATAIPNCAAWSRMYTWHWGVGTFSKGSAISSSYYYTKWKAPSGGTWGLYTHSDVSDAMDGKTISGGTTIETKANTFAIRIA